MPRGVYPRKAAAIDPFSTEPRSEPVRPDLDRPDNAVHPVEGYPTACPPPLCPQCLPDGWPDGAEQSVGCAHGMWIRELPQKQPTPDVDF